ncbi:fungal hydrophobin [Amylocystis lapponica]|nr:fungal hydrophobin [Amylocystis lapponica]
MFGHIYTVLVVLYLSLFAVAGCSSPTKTITVAAPAAPTISQCNTGPIQCCQQTQEANSLIGGILLGLLGIVVEGVDALIGLDCSPINVIGVGSGNACNASPVCCEDNSIGNLISIGCIPITL